LNAIDAKKRLMRFKGISKSLETKILQYYDYAWSKSGGIDEAEILGSLSPSLREDVKLFILGETLATVSFFQQMGQDTLRALAGRLQPRVFVDRDVILRQGDFGKEMYLIERGVVMITNVSGSVVFARLSDGDFFGESCLLRVERRNASAVAAGYCDTYCLTADAFLQVCSQFPDDCLRIVEGVRAVARIHSSKNKAADKRIGRGKGGAKGILGARRGDKVKAKAKKASRTRQQVFLGMVKSARLVMKKGVTTPTPTTDTVTRARSGVGGSSSSSNARHNCVSSDGSTGASDDEEGAGHHAQRNHAHNGPRGGSRRSHISMFVSKVAESNEQKLDWLRTTIAEVQEWFWRDSTRRLDSFSRRLWDSVLLLVVLYNAVLIPMRLAVWLPAWTFAIDFLLDILLAADFRARQSYFFVFSDSKVAPCLFAYLTQKASTRLNSTHTISLSLPLSLCLSLSLSLSLSSW
jgi:CRP-like cAMP-binding protein